MTFIEFITAVIHSPVLMITVLLNLGVLMSNGWNDAPNAIATCVSTRSLPPKASVLMAAGCCFCGVIVMSMFNSTVATTIYNMVDFSGDQHQALLAICAAMVAIVVWSCSASLLGIPTSCSHALIAGISGAAIALQDGFSGINGSEWMKVIIGLVLSFSLGFLLGFVNHRLINSIFKKKDFHKSERLFNRLEIVAAAAMAFMHGAQDGQKFMGIFMICIMLASGSGDMIITGFPLWLMFICSLALVSGIAIGGMKIIKSVGMKMVKLQPHQGFAADLSAVSCLLFCSLTGLPVSTTHTKTTAIMGVGAAKRFSAVNWGVAKKMVVNWVLTFPCCGLMGYGMALIFLRLF